jgi:alkanesulfonate monooxygenase SsuD/methylene tetrahydromethanopterin reductase-like flavin-dependent oxidoreductase (luciferase family)
VGVGSPEQVAEELIAWVDETDVDGFNLAYAVTPETGDGESERSAQFPRSVPLNHCCHSDH